MQDTYRPTTFREIVGQQTDAIEGLLNGRDTPNFLFHGPPGTGKTTTARVIARELHGSLNQLMELNASDDRGIDVVRERIIPAARQGTLTNLPRVILLDEMEAMTKDAQMALRSPVENGNAIFVLTANDRDSIHDALVSRCQEFRFGHVSDDAVRTRVEQLVESHGIPLSREQVEEVVERSGGDVRKATQLLHRTDLAHSGDSKIEAVREFIDTGQ